METEETLSFREPVVATRIGKAKKGVRHEHEGKKQHLRS